ncbi:FkbM family methyltransferase [Persicitalea jodogahamensis]|uniref:Methyltransferase FkbM domain-containing protein n=1 Tax=Persicitalea jodogahamensis TaxID=402147 RepID=A0A8J3D802_9BACT|nr:FkbM family methyltransferase [Persicitalea jodogahamensis]GHB59210.1 hypothetical protein GCM10007390_11090 [Persicitalea jodogahamensis]
MKNQIQNTLNRFGYKLGRYPDESQRRRSKLFEINKINTVIDVGANFGQYATEIRRDGYQGKIVSFEPIGHVFNELKKLSDKDNSWKSVNIALGDRDEKATINISNNIASSSLLGMKDGKIDSYKNEIFYTGTESITVKTLDSIFEKYFNPEVDTIFLKIDAQGYESKILDGAANCLEFVKGLQIEMSLVELYNGETLFLPMLNRLSSLGFDLKGIELGFYDQRTMELFQVDGIFYKK